MHTQVATQVATKMVPQFASATVRPLQRHQAFQATRSQEILQAAQQKLLATHTPLLLRIVGFLRISCVLLEVPGAYSQLLKALSDQDRAWWETCEITPEGNLHSSHPGIHQILLPICNLHSVAR